MNSKVKLFAHPGCVGGHRARKYFQCHEIPYEESPWSELVQVEPQLPKNLVIVSPMIQIGKQILSGFDPDEFEQAYNRKVNET